MCWHFRQEFFSASTAPSLARVAITSRLHANPRLHEAPELIDDIGLIVSELATNSVQAGVGVVTVAAQIHGGQARIEVGDLSPAMPRLIHADPTSAGGRGLLVVAAIAARWGVQRHPVGKTVWAVLPVPAQVSAGLRCDRAPAASSVPGSGHLARHGRQAEVGTGNDAPSTDLPEGGRGFRGVPALPRTTSLSGAHRDRDYRLRAENRANLTRQHRPSVQ
jgi:anti-sigma regulatory factor (Ser/Thr protein kinase)